jgi:hypothetical protein
MERCRQCALAPDRVHQDFKFLAVTPEDQTPKEIGDKADSDDESVCSRYAASEASTAAPGDGGEIIKFRCKRERSKKLRRIAHVRMPDVQNIFSQVLGILTLEKMDMVEALGACRKL